MELGGRGRQFNFHGTTLERPPIGGAKRNPRPRPPSSVFPDRLVGSRASWRGFPCFCCSAARPCPAPGAEASAATSFAKKDSAVADAASARRRAKRVHRSAATLACPTRKRLVRSASATKSAAPTNAAFPKTEPAEAQEPVCHDRPTAPTTARAYADATESSTATRASPSRRANRRCPASAARRAATR